ncbi:MAG TPA: asparaginase [Actinomycetota bacterium]|nr:asparaginase [Actinomycetota bacterium]
MAGQAVPLVRVVRSGLEEAVHLGDVAVVDAEGRLVAWAGDPDRAAFARSAMKPLQAAVSLSLAPFGFSDREVAVMCGSHNGEPLHVEAVRSLLARAGVAEGALRCPPSRPLDPEAATAERAPVLHNCSGKHAGMLAACRAQGWDEERYPEPDHPLQRRILEAVREGTGLEEVALGVDGCGVPVHGGPLRALARLFARLAVPEAWGPLEDSVRRAVEAMRAHPYLVAGRRRLDTAVMEAVPGAVVKGGAEGLVCAALLGPGLGVAVKVRDGATRATGPALLRALRGLGVAGEEELARLGAFVAPPVLGGGRPVGQIEAIFTLSQP